MTAVKQSVAALLPESDLLLMPMNRFSQMFYLRFAIATVAAPILPMAWVFLQTSGSVWSPFVYFWGYLVFIATGAPFLAYAYARRSLLA